MVVHTVVFVTPVVKYCLERDIVHWIRQEGSAKALELRHAPTTMRGAVYIVTT